MSAKAEGDPRAMAATRTLHKKLAPFVTPDLTDGNNPDAWRVAALTGADLLQPVPASTFLDSNGLIQDSALTLLLGQRKVGKSWLAMDIAVQVASAGRKVIFLPYEAELSTRRRLNERLLTLEYPQPVADKIALLTGYEDSRARLRAIAQATADDMDVYLQGAQLVIIDCYAHAWPSVRSDKAEEVSTALEPLRSWAAQTGNSVLLLHHLGKNVALGARGSSAFEATADTIHTLTRDGINYTLKSEGRDIEQTQKQGTLDVNIGRFNWESQPERAAREERQQQDFLQDILDAIAEGHTTKAAIRDKVNVADKRVTEALAELKLAGQIDKETRHWKLAHSHTHAGASSRVHETASANGDVYTGEIPPEYE